MKSHFGRRGLESKEDHTWVMIQTKERVVKHQVWVELAQEASWRTGWWGQLGEIPWRSLRLGERGQGNAQMGDLGSGL